MYIVFAKIAKHVWFLKRKIADMLYLKQKPTISIVASVERGSLLLKLFETTQHVLILKQ